MLPADDHRLMTLVGCIRGLVLEFDGDARYVNAWADDPALLARPPAELVGRTIDEVLGSAGAPFTAMVHRVFATGTVEHLEYPLALESGQRWFFADIKRVGVADTGFTVVFFARDITDRKAAEQAVARSEERYRLAMQATNDLLWDWDLVTDAVTWNVAVSTQLGYAAPGPTSAWWKEALHPDERAAVLASVGAALEGSASTWSGRYRFRRADDSYADFVDRGFILRNDEGRAVRMVGSMTDVTKINQLQAQLLQADRLAALGTLAAGVGHEINNPLMYVLCNVEAALDAPDDIPFVREVLSEAKDGVKRIAEIVKSLKTFSRPDDTGLREVDIEQTLEAAIKMADQEIRHRATLSREFERLPRVRGNEPQLAQVFLNVLINAAQSMAEGNVAANRIRVATHYASDGFVVIDIEDSGAGIAKYNIARVFDPFFTTKAPGGGTGLGLSICHSIVERHGGAITVTSDVGKGTRFTIRLPAIAADRVLPRVLVIDDELPIGKVVTRALRQRADVTAVTRARDALTCLAGGAQFDLILCDLMMPEMTGIDLYHELSRTNPAVLASLVFMTGGAFTPRAREFVAGSGIRCVEKPLDRAALIALLP